MTTTTPDGRTREPARSPGVRQIMPSTTAPTSGVTGVASGSLGTGTAVTDETTRIETPKLPEPATTAQAAGLLHAARRDSRPLPERAAATASPLPPEPGPSPEPQPEPALAAPEGAAARVPPPAQDPRPTRSRRDPYRPIGIVLAAVLVALAGVAVFSNGVHAPAGAVGPPAATLGPSSGTGGDDQGDRDPPDEGGGGPGNGNGHGGGNGNGNGRGNGNGNGNGPPG